MIIDHVACGGAGLQIGYSDVTGRMVNVICIAKSDRMKREIGVRHGNSALSRVIRDVRDSREHELVDRVHDGRNTS